MLKLRPVHDLGRGIRAYLAGLRWLRAHPAFLVLLFVPIAVGLVFMVGGITIFAEYDQEIMARVLFAKPAGGFTLVWFYVAQALAYVAVTMLMLLASLLLMNVAASPIYDIVSTAVEKDLTGQLPPALTWRQHGRIMLVELKKVFLILLLSTFVLFIPGLNVLSSLIAAFFAGWDFFDYPLSRRGFSLRGRLGLVASEFFAIMGLGLWLVIPFAQIVMLPLAVAGGTLLNLEALQRKRLLAPFPNQKEDS